MPRWWPLILALQPVSAAFNPVVTLIERLLGVIGSRAAVVLITGQLARRPAGGRASKPDVRPARRHRVNAQPQRRRASGWAEIIATAGLLLIIFGAARAGRTDRIAYAVGAYITAAYWFTSSTSFANPAVTIARMFSDSFAGIAPDSVPAFLLAQAHRRSRCLRPDPHPLSHVHPTPDRRGSP